MEGVCSFPFHPFVYCHVSNGNRGELIAFNFSSEGPHELVSDGDSCSVFYHTHKLKPVPVSGWGGE